MSLAINRGTASPMMDIAETLLDVLVLGSVPAYPVVQLFAWYRLHGGWRLAASLPLLVMSPTVLISTVMFVQGSPHWPMFLILASPAVVLYLLLVLVFDARRRRADRAYY